MTTDISGSTSTDPQAIGSGPPGPARWRVVSAVAGVVLLFVGLVVSAMSTDDETGTSPRGGDVVRVVRRYDAALREHDWRALQRLAAEDLTFHNTDYGSTQERAGFLAWARLIGAAYPDFFLSIDRTLFDNDVVTMWFHEDTGFTVQAVTSGVLRLRIDDGSIVEMWSNYDEFGLLRQRPVQAVRHT